VICGLTLEGEVVCWGGETYLNEFNPPKGPFVDFSLGHRQGYAMRADGTIAAWGDNAWIPHEYRTKAFAKLTNGPCALDSGGQLHCFTSGIAEPVTELTFARVSLGNFRCGEKLNGLVHCWGGNPEIPTTPPNEPLWSVTVAENHACGLRANGTAVCWGDNYYRQLDAPNVRFRTIDAGSVQTCGIGLDGRLHCWGTDMIGLQLAGRYVAVEVGGYINCALRSDGTAECIGSP
jgi:alpha-tubulin suppressor-like RCC1 family protein